MAFHSPGETPEIFVSFINVGQSGKSARPLIKHKVNIARLAGKSGSGYSARCGLNEAKNGEWNQAESSKFQHRGKRSD
jgi:hypothetical protein